MREDAVGFFWEDLATARKRGEYARVIPPVPDNGWVAPKEFPRLTDAPVLAIDCETRDTGLITMGPGFRRTGEDGAEIVGLAVGTPEGGRWYFPMRHTIAPEQNMDPGAVLAWARDNICTPGQTKVGANLAYDVDALWSEGVPVTGPFVDVQYAEALLDENRRSYALDKLGLSYLGEGKTSTELRDWCVRAYGDEVYRANIWRAPPCLVGPYAEGDVDLPLRIYEHQKLLLEQQSLTQLFSLECSLLPQLVRMRQRGVKVDIAYAKILDDELSSSIDLAQARLDGVAGKPINVNSRDDLQRLFDKAGVEYPMTKPESGAPGVPSFAKEFLSHCSHPVAELITEIRKLTKYRDTFVRGYVLNLNVMGRLHALFHPLKGDENGTVSGRFSSSLPNLQNIPVRDPVWGPRLRALFIPEDGEVWGRHDWSQIEYRFLAHYARGPSGVMVRQRYNDDPTTDFHDMTQELIRVETGTTLDRKPVKNINFGLCYGMGKKKLTNDLGLDDEAGERLFEAYHTGVPFVKATYEAAQNQAATQGYIFTVLGRRARFPLWEPVYGNGKALPEDQAVTEYGRIRRAFTHKTLNRLLQGSAADLMKTAMAAIDEAGIEDTLGPMLLTCHDETGHSVPQTAAAREALDEVKHIMETCMVLRVPVIAEQSTGLNWGQCK
jgi:DNA polymerase I-like protein with 3'-5' exonuclease and polymerase domains